MDLSFRTCLCDPIPELADAAHYLDEAVTAHLAGRSDIAEDLIRRTNSKEIREWTESLWGKKSPYVKYRFVSDAPPIFPKTERLNARMPTAAEKRDLLQRDGYHCRFCGIPVIRERIRNRIRKIYPEALPWGRKNTEQHAAFQAMWVQYDHLLPYARGGSSYLDNMVITCGPCNFARWNYTLEEVGLFDPRTREPVRTTWDGLERFR